LGVKRTRPEGRLLLLLLLLLEDDDEEEEEEEEEEEVIYQALGDTSSLTHRKHFCISMQQLPH
jgi:hypothetical protein